MNWGKWILFSFVFFAAFIGVLVVVCVRQEVSLVSKDYYRDELVYQRQIDRLINTRQLTRPPSIAIQGDSAVVQFEQFNDLEKGELILYRPSDGALDTRFALSPAPEKSRRFYVKSLPRGMYRARMVWSMKGKEYFSEHIINL